MDIFLLISRIIVIPVYAASVGSFVANIGIRAGLPTYLILLIAALLGGLGGFTIMYK